MTGRSLPFYSLLVTLNCKFIMMTSQKQEGACGRNDPSNKEEETKHVLLSLIINFNYLRHFLWLLYVATSFASSSYVIAAVCANEILATMERLYILG